MKVRSKCPVDLKNIRLLAKSCAYNNHNIVLFPDTVSKILDYIGDLEAQIEDIPDDK